LKEFKSKIRHWKRLKGVKGLNWGLE